MLLSWRNSCHSPKGSHFSGVKPFNIISSHRVVILKVSSSQSDTSSSIQFHAVFFLKTNQNNKTQPVKQKSFCTRKRGCNNLHKSLHQSYKPKNPFPFREQTFFLLQGLCLHASKDRESHRAVFLLTGQYLSIAGASSRWSQNQVNLREAAFPPLYFCQQGTSGHPRRRRGRKTWRKTNHSLLLPTDKTKKRREENMEEKSHSICSTSRDFSATCRVLCFRGICFGTFLPTTRPELHSSFLYYSLPLESPILLRTGLSVLDHCLFHPHCCTQAWKETSQLFIID